MRGLSSEEYNDDRKSGLYSQFSQNLKAFSQCPFLKKKIKLRRTRLELWSVRKALTILVRSLISELFAICS